MSRLTLQFKEDSAGFHLVAPEPVEVFDSDLTGEIGHQVCEDGRGNIAEYSLAFYQDPVKELANWIDEARRLNIPGRYDVPELGIENATFVEVLEAIKKYYQAKALAKL